MKIIFSHFVNSIINRHNARWRRTKSKSNTRSGALDECCYGRTHDIQFTSWSDCRNALHVEWWCWCKFFFSLFSSLSVTPESRYPFPIFSCRICSEALIQTHNYINSANEMAKLIIKTPMANAVQSNQWDISPFCGTSFSNKCIISKERSRKTVFFSPFHSNLRALKRVKAKKKHFQTEQNRTKQKWNIQSNKNDLMGEWKKEGSFEKVWII